MLIGLADSLQPLTQQISAADTWKHVFIDGWRLSASTLLSIGYHRNTHSSLLIFKNSPGKVTLSYKWY